MTERLPYRIIVCGGRDLTDYELVHTEISLYRRHDPIIVHGDYRGADKLTDRAAKELGLAVEPHPAMWELYGAAAGPKRNEEMAQAGADLLIAFPGGNGTRDMVHRAKAHGISVRFAGLVSLFDQ